ncbi:MAG: PLDc_N domain-containing protein [Chthoniobacterales bacterium]|nr:PLDc_N domain-containing protein [Chthoniobacterales bacterium]
MTLALGIPAWSELVLFALVPFLIWIVALISHVRRRDYPDTDKIIWTIILCTLNILGVVLYWFFAPRGAEERVLTEEELKEKFNRGA